MTVTSLGTIEKLQFNSNGYYVYLVVYRTCPVEEKFKYLRFCVWDANLLRNKETGKRFEVGNKVRVVYHFSDFRFPWLDELIPARIDETCPICDSILDLKDMSIS